VALFAVVAAVGESAADNAPPLRIAYPRPGDVVQHDTIPVWICAEEIGLLTAMTLKLNGVDLTAEFSPFSSLGDRGYHALAIVSPHPGLNRIDLTVGEQTRQVEFRFEPYPLEVQVRVLEAGKPVPARVSFLGVEGTADPALAPPIWDRIARARHMAEHRRNFIYTDDGTVAVHLPEGKYEIIASRGPAYSLARAVVGSQPGGPLKLPIARVMDTEGWVSADFHVHAMPSRDSPIPLWDRVVSYLAQDVDVIVASDHNTITDYRADLSSGHVWPEAFEAIPGTEAGLPKEHRGTLGAGHWNFWPLEREEGSGVLTDIRPRGLATVSELYQTIRNHNAAARKKRFGDFPVLIQMNHPRGMQFKPLGASAITHGHLSRAYYDPTQPLSAKANGNLLARPSSDLPRPIDVDSIELLNRLAFALYLKARQDWFAWIAQGFIPAGTANTDSHAMVITEAGFPRNWVRYDEGLPVDAASLARSVRQRQVVGSTGPLIELEPWSTDGSPLSGTPDTLVVHVRTTAWLPVEEVRVYVGGKLARTVSVKQETTDPYSDKQTVHRVEVPLSIERDTFVVVEAGDSVERLLDATPHSGPLGRLFPAVRVLAFTNPLLVDADADGDWTPPGL